MTLFTASALEGFGTLCSAGSYRYATLNPETAAIAPLLSSSDTLDSLSLLNDAVFGRSLFSCDACYWGPPSPPGATAANSLVVLNFMKLYGTIRG